MKRIVLMVATLVLAGCGTTPPAPVAVKAPAAQAQARGIFNQPVAVRKAINDLMFRYDHNRNDRLDFRPADGYLPPHLLRSERFRSETTKDSIRDPQGRVTKIIYTTYTYSHPELFAAADQNADEAVTREELEAVLATFDADQDGKLTRRGLWGWITRKEKGEYDRFQAQYGEARIDVRRHEIDVDNHAAQARLEGESLMVESPTAPEELKSAFEAGAGLEN